MSIFQICAIWQPLPQTRRSRISAIRNCRILELLIAREAHTSPGPLQTPCRSRAHQVLDKEVLCTFVLLAQTKSFMSVWRLVTLAAEWPSVSPATEEDFVGQPVRKSTWAAGRPSPKIERMSNTRRSRMFTRRLARLRHCESWVHIPQSTVAVRQEVRGDQAHRETAAPMGMVLLNPKVWAPVYSTAGIGVGRCDLPRYDTRTR